MSEPFHDFARVNGDAYVLERHYFTEGGRVVKLKVSRHPDVRYSFASAEVYDPETGNWKSLADHGPLDWHATTTDLDPDTATAAQIRDAAGPVLDTFHARITPLLAAVDGPRQPKSPTAAPLLHLAANAMRTVRESGGPLQALRTMRGAGGALLRTVFDTPRRTTTAPDHAGPDAPSGHSGDGPARPPVA